MLVLINFPLLFFKFCILPNRYNYSYGYMIYLSKDIIVLLKHCSIKGCFHENLVTCIPCISCHCLCLTYLG